MARIRTVKPQFFRHRGLYLLEQETGFPIRVAFAGIWTVADREGRFRWQADELKLDCLPYDVLDFEQVLVALNGAGFVSRYDVAGKTYGWIPSFAEHQAIPNREAQSVLPAPGDMVLPESTVVTGSYQQLPVIVGGKGREGKGREKEGKGECSEALTRSEPEALAFPTVGTDGGTWHLRAAQVVEWSVAYPNLDVLAECRRALSWVNANPGRRKTVRGMPKFLNGWLSRAVDSGRVSQSSNPGGGLGSRTTALAAADALLLRGGVL
jgi:hypothetical protein